MKNIIIAVSLVLVGSIAYGNTLPPTPDYPIDGDCVYNSNK